MLLEEKDDRHESEERAAAERQRVRNTHEAALAEERRRGAWIVGLGRAL